MGRTHAPYPLEYRRKIVELARAGRTPEELAAEFGVSSQSIRGWIKREAIDAGERNDGLTSNELAELRRLRHENKQLRLEREILSKAAAWFAKETDTLPKSSDS